MAKGETKGKSDSQRIRESDIIFDCPHCGKSLAVDYRGAGLNIPCTDCGKQVVVPIPDGMDLGDLDSTDEEKEVRIINMRKALTSAEGKIIQFQKEIDRLNKHCERLEKAKQNDKTRFGLIRDRIIAIQDWQREITEAVRKISETIKDSNETDMFR